MRAMAVSGGFTSPVGAAKKVSIGMVSDFVSIRMLRVVV